MRLALALGPAEALAEAQQGARPFERRASQLVPLQGGAEAMLEFAVGEQTGGASDSGPR